jgi:hypothetical protein
MNETLLVMLYENLSQDRKDMLQEFLVKAYTQSEFMNLQLQAERTNASRLKNRQEMSKRHFPCDVVIVRGDEE